MSIDISFSSSHATFTPSNLVQGFVDVVVHETLKAKNIRIEVEGKATTKWEVVEKSSDSHARSSRVPYSASIEYIKEEEIVWPKDNEKKLLEAGSYRFPFCFKLPDKCPPSYEGAYGSIRYNVTVTIERPWKINKSCTKPFTVVSLFPLVSIAKSMSPFEYSRTKEIGFVFFRHGKVTLKCLAAKTGYVCGESIKLTVSIQNNTSRPIVKMDCVLLEKSEYVAYRYGTESTRCNGDLFDEKSLGYNNKHTDERKLVKDEKDLFINAHCCSTCTVSLSIPPTVPSFNTSAIIHIRHAVEIKLHVRATINNTIRCICPIVIGNVPLDTRPSKKNPIREPTIEECRYNVCSPRQVGDQNTGFIPMAYYYEHLKGIASGEEE